jgi:hypothetical protein
MTARCSSHGVPSAVHVTALDGSYCDELRVLDAAQGGSFGPGGPRRQDSLRFVSDPGLPCQTKRIAPYPSLALSPQTGLWPGRTIEIAFNRERLPSALRDSLSRGAGPGSLDYTGRRQPRYGTLA